MKIILHIFSDEKVFNWIKMNSGLFSDTQNDYIILTHFYNKTKVSNKENVLIKYSLKYWIFKHKLYKTKYDVIILHKYTLAGYFLVKNKIKVTTILISFFGGENQALTKERFLLPESKKIVFKSILRELFSKNFYNPLFLLFFNRMYLLLLKISLKKFSCFSTVLPYEFDSLRKTGIIGNGKKFLHLKYFTYNYQSINNNELPQNNGIIVGNSGAFTNHIEVFNILKSLPLGSRKIFVPLSYGNVIAYRTYIEKTGYDYFGNHFSPIKSFLSSNEYFRRLAECNVFISPHLVQRAMGNILQCLIDGKSVYFFEKSSVFNYLKNCGFHVFSLEQDINKTSIEPFVILTEPQINHNRLLLGKIYGSDIVKTEITNILNMNI